MRCEEMWRRRLGALLLRSPPSSSSTAASSCQHRCRHLLPSEVPSFLFFFFYGFTPISRPARIPSNTSCGHPLCAYGLRICLLQEPLAVNRLARLFTSQAVSLCFLSNICIAVRFGSIISCSSRVSNRFTGISCFSREVMVAIPRSRSLLSS